jgi:hypothetical protein
MAAGPWMTYQIDQYRHVQSLLRGRLTVMPPTSGSLRDSLDLNMASSSVFFAGII